jgi:hypothetical protein
MGGEVAVNESRAGRRLKTGGDLEGEIEGFPQREDMARGQEVRQRFADQLLQDYVDRPVLHLPHFIDRGDIGMLDLRGPVELLPFRGLACDGLGAQDHQRDLSPIGILRMVERPFGSRAQSVEDAEATSEDPADRDSVAGAILVNRDARGC